jgi:hypothetical protein
VGPHVNVAPSKVEEFAAPAAALERHDDARAQGGIGRALVHVRPSDAFTVSL